MKPPRTVDIGPTKYKIRIPPKLPDRGHFHDYTGISLLRGMPKDIEAEVLLHEVLHGIVFTFNIRPKMETMDERCGREKGDVEEYLVTQLSTGLATVLRQNPKLVKYFTENLK
jgi:hypothetical protein